MCVVSMVADDFTRRTGDAYPWAIPIDAPPLPAPATVFFIDPNRYATKEQLDELRKELKALRELIEAAQKYDTATGQPDCEQESKFKLIRALADALGVDMGKVVGVG